MHNNCQVKNIIIVIITTTTITICYPYQLLKIILKSKCQPVIAASVTESTLKDGLAQKQGLYALKNNNDNAHFTLALIDGQGKKKSYFYKHKDIKLVKSCSQRALVLPCLVQEMQSAC